MDQFDNEYHEFRQTQQDEFNSKFDEWRKKRQSEGQTGAGSSSGSGSLTTGKSGSSTS
jgi:hypothetical protein